MQGIKLKRIMLKKSLLAILLPAIIISILLIVNGVFTLREVYAGDSIYTIQTDSFLEITSANKQFDQMLQVFSGKDFSFLRIEKIGKYYSVRIGKFTDYKEAEQFIIATKPDLSNAVILKAYIKEERIIRFNTGSISVLNETRLNTTDKSGHNIKEELYIRQIFVDTLAKAEDIIDRITNGELFEEIAFKESKGHTYGFIGRVDPSNLHPAIANALLNNYETNDPVIVETERGFHIVQRVTLPD